MAEVVTGEAVVLEVPCARFPSRVLALAIELAIQLVIISVLLTIVALGAADNGMNGAAVTAIVITVIAVALIGYPVAWESAIRGRTPGKFALGLRVIGDDGSPERFRQALVQGLAATSSWAPPTAPALRPEPASPWEARGSARSPVTGWMGTAREGGGAQPAQHDRPDDHAGTGFVPPQ